MELSPPVFLAIATASQLVTLYVLGSEIRRLPEYEFEK